MVPCANQVELHPHLTREELRQYCKKEGIFLQATKLVLKEEDVESVRKLNRNKNYIDCAGWRPCGTYQDEEQIHSTAQHHWSLMRRAKDEPHNHWLTDITRNINVKAKHCNAQEQRQLAYELMC
ncbi:hypothetical protein ANCDUO_06304 [Ancylostoma duodenale]|uniref:NADP-dependent oxidoreductase domain-containing protein n=1 Tax=Ancylostoma duodenale TaxID=51022 RepID=A0A0C2H213_9BILA|nr:hypothetical protein ANCDUO_06304 [Ancylostoma duodenale]